MTWKFTGRLEAEPNASLADCRVEVFYGLRAPRPEPVEPAKTGKKKAAEADEQAAKEAEPVIPGRASTRSDAGGEFSFELPDRKAFASPELRFVVSAPAGQRIGELATTLEAVAKRGPTIPVTPVERVPVLPVAEPPRPPTQRVSGRIIERSGRALPAGLQVLIFARRAGEPETKTVGRDAPVLVARADVAGHFFGEAPNEEFEAASALVAGHDGELPVRLTGGRIPSPVLLVVELEERREPAAGKEDCACEGGAPPRTPGHAEIELAPGTYSTDLGTGQCVQFNTPNRSIEEFSFYAVVRTTEPDIRGLTLGPNTPQVQPRPPGPGGGAPPPPPPGGSPPPPPGGSSSAPPPPPGGYVPPPPPSTGYDHPPPSSGTGDYHGATPVGSGETHGAEPVAKVSYAATAGGGVQVLGAGKSEAELSLAEARTAYWVGNRAGPIPTAQPSAHKPPGRAHLSGSNPIDWDVTPTFYEATTIAHGHLLHFKQVWYADGYSLGDLLYSLPLAPGQKKLISVVDWERRERAERDEATFASESLNAALSRDRDLSEVVTGALTESARGGSRNTTAGVGVGTGAAGNGSYQGFNFGALLGVSGGYGESDSSAWQDSARNLSSTSVQTLRDRTLQSASAIRGLRSSVVQTVSQGEAVRATTEVVANHNHCHAVTIQYFEVLRHLKLTHELADVQECLFVPLPMAEFDRTKALRWRQPLATYLQRRALAGGFDALRRVETAWSDVDYPLARYADEMMVSIAGELQLTIFIPLPPFPERPRPRPEDTAAETATAINNAVNPTTGVLGVLLAVMSGGATAVAGAVTGGVIDATKAATQGARALADSLYDQPTAQERYDKFHGEVMPGVVAGFVDQLELWALVGGQTVRIPGADFTLVSTYQPGTPLLVALRGTLPGQLRRSSVSQLIVKSAAGLPSGCRAIVNSATIRYRAPSFEHALVDDLRVNDDIDLPKVVPVVTNGWEVTIQKIADGTGATLPTPIDAWEQRSPRKEDLRLGAELIEHLNGNLEYYHHAIWWTMDPSRRYMLLDGHLAPGSGGRSVASVVENRLVGIVGNSLVLPVARGVHLDPRFRPGADGSGLDLLEHYALRSPLAPARVSLPTRGVFAEAVMGSCNACEKIDDSRFWRWEDSPIDEPPAIDATSTGTRRVEPGGLAPSTLPSPIVAIQNAPQAPDAAGVRAALDALGKQTFADITGLAGTQANAAMAYSKALDTAYQFGKEASVLAQAASMQKSLDKTMSAIDEAEQGGKIGAEDAKALRLSALKKSIGDDTSADAGTTGAQKKLDLIDGAQRSRAIRPDVAEDLNEDVLRGLVPGNTAKTSVDAMTDVAKRIDPEDIGKLSLGQEGGFEIVTAGYDPGSARRTAPAHKTGLSGLGTDQGTPTPTGQRLLQGTKGVLDTLGDALARWKDSPDASLTDALAQTLADAATEAADEITDEIPLARAMKLAVKYSLVLADGIGEGIDAASRELGAKYARATDVADTGNGLSEDDVAAIQFARRWQANDLARLNAILMQGVNAVMRKAAGELASWLSTAATKKVFAMTTSLTTHLLNKTPLKGLALGVVNATAEAIPESRREAYGLALGATFGMFVRQLDNPELRKKLKPLVDARGAAAFEKAVITGLASCLVEGTLGDPKAKDGTSFLANLREESRQGLLQRLNELIAALPAPLTVAPTQGGISTAGDEIRLPAALLREVELSDAAAAQGAFDRALAISIALEPVKKAAEANLLILARVRQPQVVRLSGSGGDPAAQVAAYEAYWEEVTRICTGVTRAYLAAGGEPDVESADVLRVETFDLQDPQNWRERWYSLIGRSGGGRGSFSGSALIWRKRAEASDFGGGGQFA